MSIYLIRHGETPGNRDRIVQVPETPLSDRGQGQARRLAERLSDHPIRRILASDLARAYMTAEAVGRALGLGVEPDPLLQERKCWESLGEYFEHLDELPLGPNVASMLGHSDLRTHVMGLDRATSSARPTSAERQQMIALLDDSLEAGFVGLSTMTNPWDKLAGSRYRSRSLPSTYATWGEYGVFHRVLRERGRILQSAPNLNTKVTFSLFTSPAPRGCGARP
jgi:N-acyl-D-aspartate/D-glutamate deacylase